MKTYVFASVCVLLSVVSWGRGSSMVFTKGPSLSDLPKTAGERLARKARLPNDYGLAETAKRRCDDAVFRIYKKDDASDILMQAYYCRTRYPNNRVTIYGNINCLFGTYPIIRKDSFQISGGAEAGMLSMSREKNQAVVVYWFQSVGLTTTDVMEFILWQYFQDLQGRRSDGLLVAFAFDHAPTPSEVKDLKQTAKAVHAQLEQWLNRQKTGYFKK